MPAAASWLIACSCTEPVSSLNASGGESLSEPPASGIMRATKLAICARVTSRAGENRPALVPCAMEWSATQSMDRRCGLSPATALKVPDGWPDGQAEDRKSVVEGKGGSERVTTRSLINSQKKNNQKN